MSRKVESPSCISIVWQLVADGLQVPSPVAVASLEMRNVAVFLSFLTPRKMTIGLSADGRALRRAMSLRSFCFELPGSPKLRSTRIAFVFSSVFGVVVESGGVVVVGDGVVVDGVVEPPVEPVSPLVGVASDTDGVGAALSSVVAACSTSGCLKGLCFVPVGAIDARLVSSETRMVVAVVVVVAVAVAVALSTGSAADVAPPPSRNGTATSAPTSRTATGQRRFSTRSETRLRRKLIGRLRRWRWAGRSRRRPPGWTARWWWRASCRRSARARWRRRAARSAGPPGRPSR